VDKITQKFVDRFSQNLMGRWPVYCPRTNRLEFGTDLNPGLDIGSLFPFSQHVARDRHIDIEQYYSKAVMNVHEIFEMGSWVGLVSSNNQLQFGTDAEDPWSFFHFSSIER